MTKVCALFTMLVASIAGQSAGGATYTIADLEQIAARNAEILSTVDLSFVETQETIFIDAGGHDGTNMPGRTIVAERTVRIVCETSYDRYYCETQVRPSDMDEFFPPVWFAYGGGEVTQMYMPSGKAASLQKTTEPLVSMRGNTILVEGFLLPPSPGGKGFDDTSILNLLRNTSLVGEESVFGDNCVVLDFAVAGVRVATFWVDPKHGVLPRKWAMFGPDGEIRSESLTPEVAEFHTPSGEPIWLPARIEQVNSVGGMTIRKVVVLDTNKTLVNPALDASDFQIDFPPGTRVEDSTGQQPHFYTVSDSGKLVPDGYLEGLFAEHLRAKAQGDLDTNPGLGCGAGLMPPALLLVTGFLSLLFVRQGRINKTR